MYFIGQKPNLLPVGTKVNILECAKECVNYDNWFQDKQDMVGREFIIDKLVEENSGLGYIIDDMYFPHWCVSPIIDEKADKIKEAIKLLEDEGIVVNGKILK